MPYTARHRGKEFEIVNTQSGKVVARRPTLRAALEEKRRLQQEEARRAERRRK